MVDRALHFLSHHICLCQSCCVIDQHILRPVVVNWVKGQFRYYEHCAFLGCLGWSGWRVVDTDILTIWVISNHPCLLQNGYSIHKLVLKTTQNVCFHKCATHRVVSGARWCSKSSIVAIYYLFGILFVSTGFTKSQIKHDRNCIWNISEHH